MESDVLGIRLRRDASRVSPKTITGAELDVDDGPARGAELFLVDGNNLAYRAFFALPEELATTDGQPTGALLGFTNMLFKLLADYGRGAARCRSCSGSSSRTCARSSRRSAIATSSSRAGRPTT
jgi:hypothetical protein